MAARLEQNAKRRAEKKPAPVVESDLARLAQEIIEKRLAGDLEPFRREFKQDTVDLFPCWGGVWEFLLRHLPPVVEARGQRCGMRRSSCYAGALAYWRNWRNRQVKRSRASPREAIGLIVFKKRREPY